MTVSAPSHSSARAFRFPWGFLFDLLLALLILVGVLFRFSWTNWSQGTSLHPDEYGLTNTLTQLSIPPTLDEYFNTRLSPISPYAKYELDGTLVSNGPDNRMRWGQWPIILLRWFGEQTGSTGYDEIRQMGRSLSAVADTLSILILILIGTRLYSRRAGLMAGALSALAVMQIQQSHFMTSDNFAALFTTTAVYAAVRAAQTPAAVRPAEPETAPYRLSWASLGWFALFGLSFGMAMASRINLLPLAGIIILAAFISVADLKLRSQSDLRRVLTAAAVGLAVAGLVSLLTFRLCQPMTFRAASGDTTFFTLHLNQDWLDSMKVAQAESSGQGGGPPAEQWANRPAILFPLMNMVVWGMGPFLGLTAWSGLLYAAWRSFKRTEWRQHLLPVVWAGGYFLFMGTRWVKSIRYFLPIYPILALLAAWLLLMLWRRAAAHPLRKSLAGALTALVLVGTLLWANAFTAAVYRQPHTRLRATTWIFHNIPAPFMLNLSADSGPFTEPLGAPDGLLITSNAPFSQAFVLPDPGRLESIRLSRPAVEGMTAAETPLTLSISADPNNTEILGQTVLRLPAEAKDQPVGTYAAQFDPPLTLLNGVPYYLQLSVKGSSAVRLYRTVLANESWDEGLPVPFENRDPFGQYYRGLSVEARWYDDANKKAMYVETLTQADVLILPSQRAIWSSARIPVTYPMTLEYYRALFDGRLGFEKTALFTAPWKFGPLQVSDVGGTLAWGREPTLPLFNYNFFAAEEAFSVYDHPPVWIFTKRADFSPAAVLDVLNAINLDAVEVQSPRNATPLYDQNP